MTAIFISFSFPAQAADITTGLVGHWTLDSANMSVGTSIARVAGQAFGDAVTGVSTWDPDMPNDVTSGNNVIVAINWFKNGSPVGTTTIGKDSGTATIGTPVRDGVVTGNTGGVYFKLEIWRVSVTGSGSLTLTLSNSDVSGFSFGINEYSGMAASPVDGSAYTNSGTGTVQSTGNITAHAGGMMIGILAEESNSSFTRSAISDNVIYNQENFLTVTSLTQDRLAASYETHALTDTTSKSFYWLAVAVAYNGTGTNALDISGNNNTGAVTGATSVTGRINQALNFTNSSSVSVSDTNNTLDATSAVSLSLWFKPSAMDADWHIIAGKGNSAANYGLWQYGNKFSLTFDAGSWVNHYTVQTYTTGKWYHLVGIIDSTNDTVALYVNGQLDIDSQSEAANMVANNQPFKIDADYFSKWANGIIDDVRVYNRVLTADDVDALYTVGGGGGRALIRGARLNGAVIR